MRGDHRRIDQRKSGVQSSGATAGENKTATEGQLLMSGGITFVCGPPGGGKSTFVTNNAKRDDMQFDLDRIAVTMNPRWGTIRNRPSELIAFWQSMRNLFINQVTHRNRWVIVCSVTQATSLAREYNGTCIRCDYPNDPEQLR